MRRFIVITAALCIAGCATPTPTPVPTATIAPTEVVPPTATGEPTETDVPTTTVTATMTPTLTLAPTVELTPDASAPAASQGDAGRPLKVTYENFHYECQQRCAGRYDDTGFWVYRSFQLLMKVENVSSALTLKGGEREHDGWAPTRWFITDGSTSRVDDYAWQYVMSAKNLMRRPDLPPGAKSEWTWIAMPLNPGEWVAAVEYVDEWGNLYRQDLPKPEGGAMNYIDCSEPLSGGC